MSKLKIFLVSSVGVGVIAASAFGIASAATTTNGSSADVGSSGIPKSTFRSDALQAAATVLNTSTSNVQTAIKDKTLKQLLQNADLTRTTFRQKVKAQLTSELQGQGYSQDQITMALQRREIVRMHRHLHRLRS